MVGSDGRKRTAREEKNFGKSEEREKTERWQLSERMFPFDVSFSAIYLRIYSERHAHNELIVIRMRVTNEDLPAALVRAHTHTHVRKRSIVRPIHPPEENYLGETRAFVDFTPIII